MFIPEDKRGPSMAFRLGNGSQVVFSALAASQPMLAEEMEMELSRLVADTYYSSEMFPRPVEKKYESFEEVVLWCASWIDVGRNNSYENVFRAVIRSAKFLPIKQYIFSSRKEEIQAWKKVYEGKIGLRKMFDDEPPEGLSTCIIEENPVKGFLKLAVLFDDPRFVEGEGIRCVMRKELGDDDIRRCAYFVVNNWLVKVRAGLVEPQELLYNEGYIEAGIMACMDNIAMSACGVLNGDIFMTQGAGMYLAGKVHRYLYPKYKDQIYSIIEERIETYN